LSEFLTVVEVLALHSILIDEFGGTEGVRDLGALEAAVFRPQTGYYKDPVAEAVALFESLIQNHPFLDGNKRTALAAADVHLRMNGLELAGDSMSHYDVIIGLMESGDLDFEAVESWLRDNVQDSRRIGRELRTPLREDEMDWLDADLD
jgi:death-on-curing protein